jgi:hypothetical protein
MKDTKFIIILGDLENKHSLAMLNRLTKIGVTRQILDNVFILIMDDDVNMNDIRSKIAGEEKGYCIVFKLDNRISFAWSLAPTNSEYLSQLIKEVQDAKE